MLHLVLFTAVQQYTAAEFAKTGSNAVAACIKLENMQAPP